MHSRGRAGQGQYDIHQVTYRQVIRGLIQGEKAQLSSASLFLSLFSSSTTLLISDLS